jgi:hypothetical protein
MTDTISPTHQTVIDQHEQVRRWVEGQFPNYHVTRIRASVETRYDASLEEKAQINPNYVLISADKVAYDIEAEYLNYGLSARVHVQANGEFVITGRPQASIRSH